MTNRNDNFSQMSPTPLIWFFATMLIANIATAEEDRMYENLYIALETKPSDYPCLLTDSVNWGKRKWKGKKSNPYPVRNSFVRCEVNIPEKEFMKAYEVCYFSGMRLTDHHLTTHSYCNYHYPSSFTAEIDKTDAMKGINGMTCSFVCKLKN